MQPVLNPGVYVFAVAGPGADLAALDPLGSFREAEGLTLIVEEARAIAAGLSPRFRAAWITLRVHSDLQAVGFTAAVSSALGAAGISCNIVAAIFHDHLFVPVERGADALDVLVRLQQGA